MAFPWAQLWLDGEPVWHALAARPVRRNEDGQPIDHYVTVCGREDDDYNRPLWDGRPHPSAAHCPTCWTLTKDQLPPSPRASTPP
jgi:hypothetical protein